MWLSVLSNTSSTALHHFLWVIQHRPEAISTRGRTKSNGPYWYCGGSGNSGTGRSHNEWLQSFWTLMILSPNPWDWEVQDSSIQKLRYLPHHRTELYIIYSVTFRLPSVKDTSHSLPAPSAKASALCFP